MISAIFIAIAAILNAGIELLENENFRLSIFKNLDPKFWYKRESWKHAKKIFAYKIDAWHIGKSLMIISLVLAVVFYQPMFNRWIDIMFLGAVWNLVFNVFYNRIFK